MVRTLRVSSALFALVFAAGATALRPDLSRLVAMVLVGIALWVGAPFSAGRVRLLMYAFVSIVALYLAPLGPAPLAFGLVAAFILRDVVHEPLPETPALFFAVALVTAGLVVVPHVGPILIFADSISRAGSDLLASLFGVSGRVGLSASTAVCALAVVAWTISAWRHGGLSPSRAVVSVVATILAWIAVLILRAPAQPIVRSLLGPETGSHAVSALLPGLLFVVPVAVSCTSARWEKTFSSTRITKAGVIATAFAAVAIAFSVWPSAPTWRPLHVLVHDEDHLSFRRPTYEVYGDRAGGMFGNLPDVIGLMGHESRRGPCTIENLDWADVVIAINLQFRFDEGTKGAIWSRIKEGMGLLVLADHTGVQGIRDPSNDLLSPVDMAVGFDAAKSFERSWEGALRAVPGPLTAGLQDERDVQIWVGASVDPGPLGWPVFVGANAFSDPGDLFAKERGFLGNLLYDPGEPLGDIVLVAAASSGRGRVLLFGDTSPYQNGALVKTWPFAHRTLVWLGLGASPPLLRIARVLLLVLGTATLLIAAWRSRTRRMSLIVCAVLLVPAVFVRTDARNWDDLPAPTGDEVVFIDTAHRPTTDWMGWQEDSIGGLEYSLMRASRLPFVLDEVESEALSGGRALFVIAPTRDFDDRELSTVFNWVNEGGVLIVTVGGDHSAACPRFLASIGGEVLDVPLGRAQTKMLANDVQFVDAWQVRLDDATDTLAVLYELPVALARRQGNGAVVLIGDTSFWHDRNLEGRETYYPGNVLLVRDLLDEYAALPGSEVIP
jgi:hypothetical protein